MLSLVGAGLSALCLLGATASASPSASASLLRPLPSLLPGHAPSSATPQAATPSPAAPATTGSPTSTQDFNWMRTAMGVDPVFNNSGYDAATVASELQRIRNLGANTVRFDIWVSAVGYPQPGADKLARIDQLVAQAYSIGLRIHMVLFDGFTQWSDISGSTTWLTSILGRYQNDQRIARVDMANEINLPSNQSAVMSWLRQMIPAARKAGGNIPVAVSIGGWCPGMAPLVNLKNGLASAPPDIYDYHYYCDPGLAFAVLRDAVSTVAPTPVVVGETGYSTLIANPNMYVYNSNQAIEEALQARYYELVETATRLLKLAPAAPWTDSDISSAACPTCAPVVRYFGVYRTDGSEKPVAAVIRATFSGAAIPNDDNLGFEEDGGGFPKCWQVMDNHGKFATDTTVARSGQASLRMWQTTHNSQTGATPGVYLEPHNPPTPGTAYTLGAWVQGAAATGQTFVLIAWVDQNWHWISYAMSPTLPVGVAPWQHLTVTSTAPSGAATLQIFLGSRDNSGTVWFDDVTLSPAL